MYSPVQLVPVLQTALDSHDATSDEQPAEETSSSINMSASLSIEEGTNLLNRTPGDTIHDTLLTRKRLLSLLPLLPQRYAILLYLLIVKLHQLRLVVLRWVAYLVVREDSNEVCDR